MGITVRKIDKEDWKNISTEAHVICFNEVRPPQMDRIDFALVNEKEGIPLTYCTIRELDMESVYFQYGGSFPNAKGTPITLHSHKRTIDWCFDNGYKRITTYVENINVAMLKVAMHNGFRIIGTRTFKNHIMVELLLESESA